MNLDHVDDEIRIFDSDQVLAEEDKPMLHAWYSGKKRLVFVIGSDCKMETEEIEGDGGIIVKHYIITRKTKDGKS